MKYSVFTDTDWLYPDSPHSDDLLMQLALPGGGHCGCQVLGEIPSGSLRLTFSWHQEAAGLETRLYWLLPVGVNENTDCRMMTTTDYSRCQDFVTRKAPFEVYDALLPVKERRPKGRLALYVCVEAGPDAVPGSYTGELCILEGKQETRIPLRCRVGAALVPPLSASRLGMLNFFDYNGLASQHNVEKNSPEYWRLYRRYVKAQVEMRCTHILLPSGQPVYQNGQLCGFDFSMAERAGQIARAAGARWLCGGPIAHWQVWDDSEYYPKWDADTGVTTPKGYLQLRLYFSEWAKIVRKNRWQGCMTQSLADEPQTCNDGTYRILAGIFRKFLPRIPVVEAVETTNLGGAIDIWVPKQDTYEKWKDEYEALKAAGEEMWFYTCAFPAGPIMNRSMDLPLTVSRLILWMAALYRLKGFLHWGFNYYIGSDIWHSACCPHKGELLPAGDAHIVYPGQKGPLKSMRFEAQRAGAEDYELLVQALRLSPEKTDSLIQSVCRDFRTYTRKGQDLLAARNKLLTLIEGDSPR